MFIFIIICVLVVGIAFLVWLLTFRNNVIEYQEKIKQAKSIVRVEKSTMSRTSIAMQEEKKEPDRFVSPMAGGIYVPMRNTVGFMQGDMGKASIYGKKTDTVKSLAQSIERAQYSLNELISEYNRYISVFPNIIVASILKCKKEEYIGEDNLNASTRID